MLGPLEQLSCSATLSKALKKFESLSNRSQIKFELDQTFALIPTTSFVSFVSPQPSMFPEAKAEENIEGKGETKPTVSCGASRLVFCYTSQLKNTTNYVVMAKKSYALKAAGHNVGHSFKAHDLITCKSKVQVVCFPRELVSSTHPRELDCFDTYMTRDMFSPNRKTHLSWVV